MPLSFSSASFHNITVSGRAVSGATTLSRLLAKKLGWKLINGGELVRMYMKEKGIPLEKTALTSDKYHLELDDFITEKLRQEKNLIIESWLSGFDASGISGVYKILVICSDEKERIKRIMQRDGMTQKEAGRHLTTRQEENLKKWEKLYRTRDFWNPKFFDLMIDTANKNAQETLNTVLENISF
ncbi:hypothetical protein A2Y99_00880 [Candidatus Gottesmanbacteria bacterium RBG_13_37_7]|uniref:(d)CMP kinase n=1 Tax=Candidatus Gottesmanbacteria bacterium RBG_13_37_7 TaxID=1798369 RepID=A0A1F5YJP6_9BACT|nr:MAG: hypothetical protein A2Y99_00880 [Candidatus Gottesmanbacteria bacterium RBG_13_37_7]